MTTTPSSIYRPRSQLFRNIGLARFRHVTEDVGGPLLVEQSSRGAALGDYDNDGDVDIFVSVIDGQPMPLRNDSTGGHWITVRLEGTTSNRSAIGAKVIGVSADAGSWRKYAAAAVEQVTIRWPHGDVESLGTLAADRFYVAREGDGIRPGR